MDAKKKDIVSQRAYSENNKNKSTAPLKSLKVKIIASIVYIMIQKKTKQIIFSKSADIDRIVYSIMLMCTLSCFEELIS